MVSNDDNPPKQELILPDSAELQPLPAPPAGAIKNAFYLALHFGMRGRALAAFNYAMRQAAGAHAGERGLIDAIVERMQAQIILDNFDKHVAPAEIDRLVARAAKAKTARLDAEIELFQAERRHREARGEADAVKPDTRSREEHEIAQYIDARARQRTSGQAKTKLTKETVNGLRDMLKARRLEESGGKFTEDTIRYCAEIDALAKEAIETLSLAK